jgi:hypothetical protein
MYLLFDTIFINGGVFFMKKISTAADTKEITLTIYNGGFGAVKEKRTIHMEGEEREIIFADVAQQIETDSLIVEGVNIQEFNYDFDLVDKDKLLRKYIDKEVYLKDRRTGDKKQCRLLSVEGAGRCVLEDTDTKEIYLDTQSEIILPSLPSGLIIKPALVWKTDGRSADEVQVSYLSGGFKWTANYVVELKAGTLNLIGWAEIENKCGMSFENAKIKLIAGEVNRIKDEEDEIDSRYYVCESAAAPQAEEKAFFDYHMYTLNQQTTLKDNQSKQICILSGNQIPYKQYYQLDLHEEKADVIVEFINCKDDGLGVAMPKGKIKLYKEDEADASLEFIGEDQIEHTSNDESIKLSIGKAFDIAFEYSEVDRKKVSGFEHYKYDCIIRNHKNTEAEIRFEPYVWGAWEMVESSHEFTKKTATQLEYRLSMPAASEVLVQFEYKIDRRTEVVVKK